MKKNNIHVNGFKMSWRKIKKKSTQNKNFPITSFFEILEESKKMLKIGFRKLDVYEKGCFVGKYRWGRNKKIEWYFLGDMRRVLKKTFNNWDYIEMALNCIPPNGYTVEEKHYKNFFDYLKKGVHIKKGISFATRLLCLKRPDVFVSVTKTNRPKLIELFGGTLTSSKSYWNFIKQVQNSKWYQEVPRKDDCYHYRMALLDVIAYKP